MPSCVVRHEVVADQAQTRMVMTCPPDESSSSFRALGCVMAANRFRMFTEDVMREWLFERWGAALTSSVLVAGFVVATVFALIPLPGRPHFRGLSGTPVAFRAPPGAPACRPDLSVS